MSITIYDVAKRAKVSPSWVSWALRDHPRAQEIRPETRERIRNAAKELGYLKNRSATTIRTGFNASTVALLATGNVHPQGNFSLLTRLNALGYELRFYSLGKPKKAFEEILANQLRYVICKVPIHEVRLQVAELCRANGIRAVFLGAGAVGMGYPVFSVDTRREMCQLTRRFFSLGHTEIALLCGVHRYCATELRHLGYLDAFREHGLEPDPEMTLCEEYSTQSFLHFVERKRPTALACIDGLLATRALNDLIRHGVRVPEDISILAITGMDLLPSILTIGRFTEPEGISEQNALEFLFSGKCSAPLTEDGLQLVLESVYHPGETEAPPPQRVRRYRELWKHDIFRKTSS